MKNSKLWCYDRFVDQKCEIREELLTFVKCTSQTTEEVNKMYS